MKKRWLAMLLCISMLCSMLPTMAWAAEDQGLHTLSAHENCALTQGGRAATTVTSLTALQNAINGGTNVDVVLSPVTGDSAT